MTRLAFGFMTGTSCDGLDGAAVRVEGAGLAMRCVVVGGISLELGPLADRVRRLARGGALTAGEAAGLALELAELHAEGVRRLREVAGGGTPDLLAVHGQTVFHDPPVSWQMVNPWPIAREGRCPVVTDLRGADLAAGGQGAPITPIADWILFRDGEGRQTRVVVNLGGFCNITLLPGRVPPPSRGGEAQSIAEERAGFDGADSAQVSRSDGVRDEADLSGPGPGEPGGYPAALIARDVCACNHVLDAAARVALGQPFDADGAAAARGAVDDALRAELERMLGGQARSGRSLGSTDEMVGEVERVMADRVAAGGGPRQALSPEDAMGTAVAAVAGVIAAAVNELSPAPDLVLVAGGSVRNRAMIAQLAAMCRAPVTTTADFGVDPQYREAAAMAIVGCLAQDGAPVALPHVTGAKGPILWSGSWTNLPPARTAPRG